MAIGQHFQRLHIREWKILGWDENRHKSLRFPPIFVCKLIPATPLKKQTHPIKKKHPYVVSFLMQLNSTAVIAVERQKLKPFFLITVYAEERLFVTLILFLGNSIPT